MQIPSQSLSLATTLNGPAAGQEKSGKTAQADSKAISTDAPAPIQVRSDSADSVSISSTAPTQQAEQTNSPVYAEIWRGSIKLAQVDIYGHVESFTGLVLPGGGGSAGALLAAQRAVQIAQQTGGEIRTAGQTLDSQTLMMRARLANTYIATTPKP